MRTILALWLPLCLFLCALVRALLHKFVWVSVENIPHFLKRVDLCALEKLLDPGEEAALKMLVSEQAFAELLAQRLAEAIDLLSKMGHNVKLFQRFGNESFKKIAYKKRTQFDEIDWLIIKVISSCEAVQDAISRAKLSAKIERVLIIGWGVTPTPGMAFKTDMLSAYEDLAQSIAELSLTRGDAYYQKIISAMGTPA